MAEMKMNDAVREMKKTPGTYYITNTFGRAIGLYLAVEVDTEGNVWQLTPEGVRDNVPSLADDGWYDDVEVMTELPEDMKAA